MVTSDIERYAVRSMLLTFKRADGKQTTLGPLAHFRFDREELRETTAGPVLARHEGHHWQAGEAYLRLDYDAPIKIASSGRSCTFHRWTADVPQP
jgi:hypothetical protein